MISTLRLRLAAFFITAAFLVFCAFQYAQTRAENKHLKDTQDTIERIDDALDNSGGCAWADRLRGTCD